MSSNGELYHEGGIVTVEFATSRIRRAQFTFESTQSAKAALRDDSDCFTVLFVLC